MIENFINALLSHAFLQNAFLAGALASIVCGISGTFVVVKRISSMSGGLAHAILGGVGIATYFQFSPLLGAFIFAFLASVILGVIKLRGNQHEDTIISALWAVGMALGILFIFLTPGYETQLQTYLFGNILMIESKSLYYLFFLNCAILILVFVFYRQFILICFDQEYARLRGLKVEFLYILLLCMIAFTIVVLIYVVGLILVIALLTLPASIATLFSHRISKIILSSIAIGFLFILGGLFTSYQANLPSGATIILIAGSFYLIALLFKKLKIKKNQEKT